MAVNNKPRGLKLVNCAPLECKLTKRSCAARWKNAQQPHSPLWESPCHTCNVGWKRAGMPPKFAKPMQVGEYKTPHGTIGKYICGCGRRFNKALSQVRQWGLKGCGECYKTRRKTVAARVWGRRPDEHSRPAARRVDDNRHAAELLRRIDSRK